MSQGSVQVLEYEVYYHKYCKKPKTGFSLVVLYVLYDTKFLFMITIQFYITVPTNVI
jgi:hypothetical protein